MFVRSCSLAFARFLFRILLLKRACVWGICLNLLSTKLYGKQHVRQRLLALVLTTTKGKEALLLEPLNLATASPTSKIYLHLDRERE